MRITAGVIFLLSSVITLVSGEKNGNKRRIDNDGVIQRSQQTSRSGSGGYEVTTEFDAEDNLPPSRYLPLTARTTTTYREKFARETPASDSVKDNYPRFSSYLSKPYETGRYVRANYGGSKSGYFQNVKGVYTGSLSDDSEEDREPESNLRTKGKNTLKDNNPVPDLYFKPKKNVDDYPHLLQRNLETPSWRNVHPTSTKTKSVYSIKEPLTRYTNHRVRIVHPSKSVETPSRTHKRENSDTKTIQELREFYKAKLDELAREPINSELPRTKVVFPNSESNNVKTLRWSYDKNIRRPHGRKSERSSSKIRFEDSPTTKKNDDIKPVEEDQNPYKSNVTSEAPIRRRVNPYRGLYTGPILGKSFNGYVTKFASPIGATKLNSGFVNFHQPPQVPQTLVAAQFETGQPKTESNIGQTINENHENVVERVKTPSRNSAMIMDNTKEDQSEDIPESFPVPIPFRIPIPYSVKSITSPISQAIPLPLIVSLPISHPAAETNPIQIKIKNSEPS